MLWENWKYENLSGVVFLNNNICSVRWPFRGARAEVCGDWECEWSGGIKPTFGEIIHGQTRSRVSTEYHIRCKVSPGAGKCFARHQLVFPPTALLHTLLTQKCEQMANICLNRLIKWAKSWQIADIQHLLCAIIQICNSYGERGFFVLRNLTTIELYGFAKALKIGITFSSETKIRREYEQQFDISMILKYKYSEVMMIRSTSGDLRAEPPYYPNLSSS